MNLREALRGPKELHSLENGEWIYKFTVAAHDGEGEELIRSF